MKLIIGLGNPGVEYKWTRHNIGFIIIDEICKKLNITCDTKGFKGLYTEKIINNEKIYFLKPMTFMNLSGECVSQIINYFKININDIIIIYDDFNIDFGSFRLKPQGSGSGHKGVANIVQHLQTNKIKQVKIGIGKNNNYLLKDWVLKKFTTIEKEKLLIITNKVSDIIIDFSNGTSFEKLMNQFNERGAHDAI